MVFAGAPAILSAQSGSQPSPSADLTSLSLEDLADLKVTSVSKVAEEGSTIPAAFHVLTGDDIRRSGATTIPEMLRLVPGLEVARLDTDHWSVGVRGFGDQFSKSVLVLIDGRNVYTPLFAGVFWAVQDLVLADIERIEVIRGPGGRVWGANAVNGVINIITKPAAATHGGFASLATGTVEHGIGEFRLGGGNGRGLDYRLYAKGFTRGPQHHADGRDFDDWRGAQVGARADWSRPGVGAFTFQGDAYSMDVGQSVRVSSFSPPGSRQADEALEARGANLMARWRHVSAKGGEMSVDAYYDHTSLDAPNLAEARNTFDLDFVHRLAMPARQELLWGLGLRHSPSRVEPTAAFDFDPRQRTTRIYSAFVQDEIRLPGDRLTFTLGSKFEHYDYTGLEVQPRVSVAYALKPRQAVWAAVTRAVRTPSRLERDAQWSIFAATPPPSFLQIDGNKAFESESLHGFEAGYRSLLAPWLYLSLAAFHNVYDHLQSFGPPALTVEPDPSPHVALHLPYENGVEGSSNGFEVAVDAKPAASWQLKASYSFLGLDLEKKDGAADTLDAVAGYEGSSPRHVVGIQSRIDLPGRVEFDQTYRYVTALPYQRLPGYHSVDLRGAWRVRRDLEVSVVGQNLLQPRHSEFEHDHEPQVVVQVRRSFYVQVAWTR